MVHISKNIPDTIIFEDSEVDPTAFHTGSSVYIYTSQCNEYKGKITEINVDKNYIVVMLECYSEEPLYATIPADNILEMYY